MRTATLRVYESEADSDYDLKPMGLNQGHTSTENLADDEREDSSEAEPEPEPDYDDDLISGRSKGEGQSKPACHVCQKGRILQLLLVYSKIPCFSSFMRILIIFC